MPSNPTLSPEKIQEGIAVAAHLCQQGKFQDVQRICNQILQSDPNCAEAFHMLGLIANHSRQPQKAVELLRRAIELQPDAPYFYNNLGLALSDSSDIDGAIEAFNKSIELKPDYFQAHANLANIYRSNGDIDAAIESCRRAVALEDRVPQLHYNLGNLLEKRGDLAESVECYRRSLEQKPTFPEAYNNLGNALRDQGRMDETIQAYETAFRQQPGHQKAHSNYIFCLHYSPRYSPTDVVRHIQSWSSIQSAGRTFYPAPHKNSRDPDRKIRVGFVSPNLRTHPHGFFIEGMLENRDRDQLEVYCYADIAKQDETSDRLETLVDGWQLTGKLRDEQLESRVREDGIDILVDMCRHTAGNRLRMFAHKPAPIQVTWMGGPQCSSGLSAMDYILSDVHHIPESADDQYIEKVYRLPDDYISYRPPAESPAVGPLPCRERGDVTFGSFNVLAKIHDQVVELWSRIMNQVDNSRIVLKTKAFRDEGTCRRYLDLFAGYGIDADRIELQGLSPQLEVLEAYNQIDIALDTFPYNGGVTTCEALWMGVPTIVLRNTDKPACGHSTSHLANANCSEFIADSFDDYVNLATTLAGDVDRLAEIRAGLRDCVASSSLCDAAKFARSIQIAFRSMWHEWCGR